MVVAVVLKVVVEEDELDGLDGLDGLVQSCFLYEQRTITLLLVDNTTNKLAQNLIV